MSIELNENEKELLANISKLFNELKETLNKAKATGLYIRISDLPSGFNLYVSKEKVYFNSSIQVRSIGHATPYA